MAMTTNQRERRKAARTLIDGRLVAPIAEEMHGSITGYNNYFCRCKPCADARYRYDKEKSQREREAARRANRRARET